MTLQFVEITGFLTVLEASNDFRLNEYFHYQYEEKISSERLCVTKARLHLS